MTGAIIVDKPAGWTSHDVVGKLRRLLNIKKIGHLGTLDPAASGVLPLLVGRATRLARFYTKNDKVYEGVIRFGWSTNTYDRDGEPVGPKTEPVLDRDRLEKIFDAFRGCIRQIPPPVSAKKIAGTPAYKLARQHKPVELEPVEVTVHALEILHCEGATVRVRVHCSAGTYLRAIAHDAGQAYGGGAFLESLVRTRSGDFTLEQARTIAQLEELAREERLIEALIPAADILPELPAHRVDNLTAGQIRQGRDFRGSPFRASEPAALVKAISEEGDLVAIGEARLPNVYHPIVVL